MTFTETSTSHLVRASARTMLVASLAFSLAACSGVLGVDNPNNVTSDALKNPAAAPSIINGAENATVQSMASVFTPYAAITDEAIFKGSRDDYQQLDQGQAGNPANEYTNQAAFTVNQARWLADNAVTLLEGFQADGKLNDPDLLNRAYLNKAVIYALIGDMFDDFTISDRTVASPAVGEANMFKMYDSAQSALEKGIAASSGDLKATMLGVRARVKHARGIFAKLNPVPARPADPLIADNGYVADAQAALAAGLTRYVVQVTQQNEGNPNFGFEMNSRVELTPSPTFVTYLPSFKPDQYILKDLVDPSAEEPFAKEAILRTNYPDLPNDPALVVVTANEMQLLLAEGALAAGNTAGFDSAINALRASKGLVPYTGAGPTRLQLLEFERKVALLFQGRRLNDMYRFGTVDPQWNANSTAVKQPGCLFPIGISERESNPNLLDHYQPVCR